MKDTALYEQLLGLKSPWSVKTVDLSLAEQRVVVEVVLKRGQVWADPTDASKRAHIHGWTERQWRHLDTCQFETLINCPTLFSFVARRKRSTLSGMTGGQSQPYSLSLTRSAPI